MHACGVVVEYNPFHNGHLYHLQKAKELTKADCIIAVMSGSFLQRGEPAIIDKFHRTQAALAGGADIVIELPYAYAVQSSNLFAKGALLSLHELGVSSICFGSESGNIEPFFQIIDQIKKSKQRYDQTIRTLLRQGISFPKANQEALNAIGLTDIDIVKPNNILGYSYVKTIDDYQLPIKPYTIQRIHNDYHDTQINHHISSATSIRHELINHELTDEVHKTLPDFSFEQMQRYHHKTSRWHTWSDYFPYLAYQLMSQSAEQLAEIQGMEEGLENRIKNAILSATSFKDLMDIIQTKRYTKVRLQRVFTHVLTNTKKSDIIPYIERTSVPYVRLLGMNETGQLYLNKRKKHLNVPMIANLNKKFESLTSLDEKATQIYYSILPIEIRQNLLKQEFKLPMIL